MADALSAHERALSFGGLHGVPNVAFVEAAVARPYSGYHRSIEAKAAALVESMVNNHGFADGCKRTTLLLVTTLVERSGYHLRSATPEELIDVAIEDMLLGVAKGHLTFDGIAAWFKMRLFYAEPPKGSAET